MARPREYPESWARYHWATYMAACERRLFQRALRQTAGNVTAAARLMGISRTTAARKIRQYGLQQEGRSHMTAPALRQILELHFEHRFSVRTHRTGAGGYLIRWLEGPTVETVRWYASHLDRIEGQPLYYEVERAQSSTPGGRGRIAKPVATSSPKKRLKATHSPHWHLK